MLAALETFRTPEAVTASLQGAPFADQAREEWVEVLASPFSPIPSMEEALSCEWENLPTDAEGIA
ncbi:MAG TPA: hypothetical protein DD490_10845, partial [Acidobacteria bacterium]|nr:hypothetical protein [Acidobacteriota bacterium]